MTPPLVPLRGWDFAATPPTSVVVPIVRVLTVEHDEDATGRVDVVMVNGVRFEPAKPDCAAEGPPGRVYDGLRATFDRPDVVEAVARGLARCEHGDWERVEEPGRLGFRAEARRILDAGRPL
jgi:hypothetical protein